MKTNELYKIYAAYFFTGLVGVASFIPLYFLSLGINQAQLGFLVSAHLLTVALLEVPTGAIADTFSHKTSVFWGTLIYAISFLFLFWGTSFRILLIGMIIGGAGLALTSGAVTSLLYDLLEKMKRKTDFKKVYARCDGLFLIASMLSAPFGGWIYIYQPALPFLIAAIVTFIGSLLIYWVHWVPSRKKHISSTYFKIMGQGFFSTLKLKPLRALILISVGLSIGAFVINHNLKQPFLVQNQLTVPQIGVFTSVISGISALFYMVGHKLIHKIGDSKTLLFVILLNSFSLIALSKLAATASVLMLGVYLLLPPFRDPVITHLQQKEMSKIHRSTMSSTISLILRLTVAIALPLYGFVIDKMGISPSIFYLALITGSIALVGYFLYKPSNLT